MYPLHHAPIRHLNRSRAIPIAITIKCAKDVVISVVEMKLNAITRSESLPCDIDGLVGSNDASGEGYYRTCVCASRICPGRFADMKYRQTRNQHCDYNSIK